MNPLVIDISHHQPDPIDWKQLKAAGTVGVIHKATEGASYVDDKLFSRARAAMDAGLLWATYHFMRPGSVVEQMDHYLTTVDPKMGERVVLDHEDEGVSLVDLENAVDYLLAIRPDLQVTIYSGHLIKEQLEGGWSPMLADTTSLWIAQYTSAESPTWPYDTWPAWSLWQYTDSGTAVGVTGNVDCNRWNGTVENLVEWFGPAGAIPEPAPELAEVDIAINVRGATVSITLNGEVVLASKQT